MSLRNFACLDEAAKCMRSRVILKAVAIPGYQMPFSIHEMPMPCGKGAGNSRAQAHARLGRVEVHANRLEESPTTFSGGEQQRVNIARSSMTGP